MLRHDNPLIISIKILGKNWCPQREISNGGNPIEDSDKPPCQGKSRDTPVLPRPAEFVTSKTTLKNHNKPRITWPLSPARRLLLVIQALLTLVTKAKNNTKENVRLLPLDRFRVSGSYPHSDWGNPQLVEIAGRAASWPSHVAILTADGFFCACLLITGITVLLASMS